MNRMLLKFFLLSLTGIFNCYFWLARTKRRLELTYLKNITGESRHRALVGDVTNVLNWRLLRMSALISFAS